MKNRRFSKEMNVACFIDAASSYLFTMKRMVRITMYQRQFDESRQILREVHRWTVELMPDFKAEYQKRYLTAKQELSNLEGLSKQKVSSRNIAEAKNNYLFALEGYIGELNSAN